MQLNIYKAYIGYWWAVLRRKRKLGATVVGVFGGEGSDDNKHSKYQLATVNESTAIQAGVVAFAPVEKICDRIYYNRGTEAHAGGAGWMEEQVARQVKNVVPDSRGNYSRWFCRLTFHGVRAFFAHHPYSNSTRRWTLGGGAMRTAETIVGDHDEFGETPPQFAAFGHVHHYEDSGETRRCRVYFSDSWTVPGAFEHRIGFGGRYSTVGGLIFTIMPDGTWKCERFRRWVEPDPYEVVV